MKLADFSVKNSLLVNLVSIFIVLAGIYSMLQMRREAFPSVNYDILLVQTVYPGAPTEDVEKLVTIPLEEELKGISGIEKMMSSSDEGYSEIGIYIDPNEQDKQKVVNDVQSAVDRVRDLPDTAEDPVVFEIESKEIPIIEISLGGDVSEEQRRLYAETLEDMFLDIDGVSKVRRIGWRDKEVWVEVDPGKLKEYHVSMTEIMDALRTRNVTVPAGQLKTASSEFNVRTTGEFATPQEISNVVIRSNDAGNFIKVRDVARVSENFEDETRIAKVNGARSTAMVVLKKETADAITLVAQVRSVVEKFEETLPEKMEVLLANDFSYYVKRRLNVLKNNGIIGFGLVILVLFLFLDPMPALMTAVGIPIALFTTLTAMSLMGISINLVSMIGLLLVLGMIVDDGIIVSENVYRYIEKGMDPKKAAILGTNEVATPVIVTILTTCAAFSPLMFMTDILGKFIREIPIVVMLTLGASLLEAFIILPSHLSDFVKGKVADLKAAGTTNGQKKWFQNLTQFYGRILNGSIRFRYVVVVGLILALIGSIALVRFNVVKIVMFGGEGIEYFFVRAEAAKGTPLSKMNELMLPVEELMSTIPAEDLDAYRTYIGSITTERNFDPNAKRGSHLAQITVFLTPLQQRGRSPYEIMDSLRPQLAAIRGFEKLYFYLPKEGPPSGQPIEVGVKGEDFKVLNEIAGEIVAFLEGIDGVEDITTSYDYGKKQLRVVVDEEKAKRYSLTIGQIAASVRNAFQGGIATTIKPSKAEKEIDVLVRFPEEYRDDEKAFERILVPNRKGNLIPLTSVAKIEESEGIYLIRHLDGKRVVYVTGQVDDEKETSLSANLKIRKEFANISEKYLGYTLKYSGEYEDQMKSFKNLVTSFAFALCIIFIILVTMFGSLIQPFIVMMAIPFGIVGVIIAFLAHGRPLSFFGFLGLVGLTGVVVNDSIVLVDFINRLRKKGKERRESLIEAGKTRLRPVLMTSITTIGGLVSVAYGIGGGDPFLKPMALSIIWGLFFATGLTLIGIPCIYAIVDDFSKKVLHHSTVKQDDFSS